MTDALAQELDGIMDDLAKLADSPEGAIRQAHLAGDLLRMVAMESNEATRPRAEAMMKAFEESGDPLRKRIAQHWLDRCKAMIDGKAPGRMAPEMAAEVAAKPGVHPAIQRLRDAVRRRKSANG